MSDFFDEVRVIKENSQVSTRYASILKGSWNLRFFYSREIGAFPYMISHMLLNWKVDNQVVHCANS